MFYSNSSADVPDRRINALHNKVVVDAPTGPVYRTESTKLRERFEELGGVVTSSNNVIHSLLRAYFAEGLLDEASGASGVCVCCSSLAILTVHLLG